MISGDFNEHEYRGIMFSYRDSLPFEKKQDESIAWLYHIIEEHGYNVESLNYVFCNDEELYTINLEHLNHDTYTDIITFDYSDEDATIYSDIYISLERITENASILEKTFDEELHRVLVHGVLHLLGYDDKTEDDKITMREKENTCLSLRK